MRLRPADCQRLGRAPASDSRRPSRSMPADAVQKSSPGRPRSGHELSRRALPRSPLRAPVRGRNGPSRSRPESILENRPKIRPSSAAGIPHPESLTARTTFWPARRALSSIRPSTSVWLTAFSMSASRAMVSRSPSTGTASATTPSVHRRGMWRHRRRVSAEVRDIHRSRCAGSPGHPSSEQQHPACQPAHPEQLVHRHPRVPGDGLVSRSLLDQLGVTESNGDRRAQLVGGVLEELALLIQQAQVVLRDAPHILQGRHPPAGVPDHDHEHHGEQRDLREIVRVLLPLQDLPADQAAGSDSHQSVP